MSKESYIHGASEKELGRLSKLNNLTNSSFIKYLNIKDGSKICEVGCGIGNLLVDIAELYPTVQITGIEISTEHFKVASERVKNLPNVNLINVDFFHNELSDNSFDLVYCRYFLEHVSDPKVAVTDMVRITVPGGHIVSQENDLENVTYYPPIPGHDRVLKSFCDLQLKLGGDPFIGRKLFELYKESSASEIQIDIEPEVYSEVTPDKFKIWINNSMQILLGAKENLTKYHLLDIEAFDQTIKEMEQRISQPKGVSLFYWNRIKARK